VPAEPIFLLSLPRSGSTFVQRVLAAHPAVATQSEPWLLLPLFYATRRGGVRAEYWHTQAVDAIDDFCRELPGGTDDYLTAVRELALSLYSLAAGPEARYFLDKSPHYHFVLDELFRTFPDARFVFLWRNPLASISSAIETWRGGRWQPSYFVPEYVDGLRRLVKASEAHRDRVCAVRYEDLVAGDEQEWRRVFRYLDLEFDADVLSGFAEVPLKGRFGDQVGVHEYSRISQEPLNKWRRTLAGPVRTAWCRRYLREIGSEPLEAMGYNAGELERQVTTVEGSPASVVPDFAAMTLGWVDHSARRRTLRMSDIPIPRGSAHPYTPAHRRLARRAKHALVTRGGPRSQAEDL
jgi:hypothetical protein